MVVHYVTLIAITGPAVVSLLAISLLRQQLVLLEFLPECLLAFTSCSLVSDAHVLFGGGIGGLTEEVFVLFGNYEFEATDFVVIFVVGVGQVEYTMAVIGPVV